MTIRTPQIDEDQLQSLLLKHAGQLRAYVTSKVPTDLQSLVGADDVLQEVWTAAFRNIETFRAHGPGAFERWLRTIAARKIIDHLKAARAVKRGGRVGLLPGEAARRSSMLSLFAKVASAQRTPSRDLSDQEAFNAMQVAISSLSDEQRRAVVLRHIEERPITEIAELMNKTEGAVRGLLFRSILVLRRRMGGASRYFSDALSADGPSAT